jgi:hypothetical protein
MSRSEARKRISRLPFTAHAFRERKRNRRRRVPIRRKRLSCAAAPARALLPLWAASAAWPTPARRHHGVSGHIAPLWPVQVLQRVSVTSLRHGGKRIPREGVVTNFIDRAFRRNRLGGVAPSQKPVRRRPNFGTKSWLRDWPAGGRLQF